jgi:hypothetical protein
MIFEARCLFARIEVRRVHDISPSAPWDRASAQLDVGYRNFGRVLGRYAPADADANESFDGDFIFAGVAEAAANGVKLGPGQLAFHAHDVSPSSYAGSMVKALAQS